MSRHRLALATLLCAAMIAVPATAQTFIIDAPPVAETPDYLDAVSQMAPRRRTRADCIAEAMTSSDIVVCAPRDDQQLPVPEVYGPAFGSTDGAAVDPRGPGCGASISNQCYGGIDIIATIGGTIKLVGLLLDPDANLGEGDPIPERFRGANR